MTTEPVRMGWWGGPDLRPRCVPDGKVILSEEDALRKAKEIRERKRFPGDERMVAYKCRKGNWHLGHSRQRRWG